MHSTIDSLWVCPATDTLSLVPLRVPLTTFVVHDGTRTVSLAWNLIKPLGLNEPEMLIGTAVWWNVGKGDPRRHTKLKRERKRKQNGRPREVDLESLRQIAPYLSSLPNYLGSPFFNPLRRFRSVSLSRAQNTQTCNEHTHTSIHTEIHARATCALPIGVQWGECRESSLKETAYGFS